MEMGVVKVTERISSNILKVLHFIHFPAKNVANYFGTAAQKQKVLNESQLTFLKNLILHPSNGDDKVCIEERRGRGREGRRGRGGESGGER
jgi:hypothetical protein